MAVCVDCMFDLHNGHLLTNVNEMCKLERPHITFAVGKIVKQNSADLSQMMIQSRRITEDNLQLTTACREELNKLLNQQQAFIEDGFNEVIRRLTEKKN